MNRLVYLFELDSVKTDVLDAEAAEIAIFNEIIKNGNKVVLSMNQLTDSRVMAAAMNDEEGYRYVRRLFERGSMKVSLYGTVRTASQYVQNAIDKCLDSSSDAFIFSTLPVKSCDKAMLMEMKHSLVYSDLSNIKALLDSALDKLGREKDLEKKSEILAEIRRIRAIRRFLSLVLHLSVNSRGTNPPRSAYGRSFVEFMGIIKDTLAHSSFRRRELNMRKGEVLDKLRRVEEGFVSRGLPKGQWNHRTNWIKQLKSEGADDASTRLAIEVVNLCYNYTVEDSIRGVTKKYDEENFEVSFKSDFIRRLNAHWKMRGDNVVDTDTDLPEEYSLIHKKEWKRAAEIAEYNSGDAINDFDSTYDEKSERKMFRGVILKKIGIALLVALGYIVLFCLIETALDFLQSLFSNGIEGLNLNAFVSGLICIVVFGIINSVIAIFTKAPDILTCFSSIAKHIRNFFLVIGGKYEQRI